MFKKINIIIDTLVFNLNLLQYISLQLLKNFGLLKMYRNIFGAARSMDFVFFYLKNSI